MPGLRADVPVSEPPFPESEQVKKDLSDSSIPGEHTIIILSFILLIFNVIVVNR